MISEKTKVPAGTLTTRGQVGLDQVNPQELFATGTHVLFAVPGAFTPTCSEQHLPGYVRQAEALRSNGVDGIYCVATNDAFVMASWAKEQDVGGSITMLSDGDGSWLESMELTMDTGNFGGVRAQRFAMIIRDGVIDKLFVEDPKSFDVSSVENVLKHL
ncbi:peroxiredoxin [Aliidiomarina indica]|uniref:peroxiredoxin n=1 Tax=Aliidiomarina indica TaxID=2749147 RepID=UPI00188E2E50|nr:peroxiredoxin [Aliidiomarina indica]